MPKYIFTSIVGIFVFDNSSIIDEKLFSNFNEFKNCLETERKLIEKYKAVPAEKDSLKFILEKLKDKRYLENFRKLNLSITKEKIKNSINEDNLICQSINSIRETDKVLNTLIKRLREWYSLYFPELSESVSKNEIFVEIVLAKDKKDLLIELKVDETMGKDLEKKDIKKILDLAKQCEELFKYREQSLLYVDDLMEKYCPNLKAIAGTSIGAKLIEHTGSLRKIAMLPASTIQILGAEKALFRHLKTGARPPKFGIIFDHQFIQKSQRKDQGKRARSLADKLCIAAKIDFFKGEFIGDKLRKELESKFQ